MIEGDGEDVDEDREEEEDGESRSVKGTQYILRRRRRHTDKYSSPLFPLLFHFTCCHPVISFLGLHLTSPVR